MRLISYILYNATGTHSRHSRHSILYSIYDTQNISMPLSVTCLNHHSRDLSYLSRSSHNPPQSGNFTRCHSYIILYLFSANPQPTHALPSHHPKHHHNARNQYSLPQLTTPQATVSPSKMLNPRVNLPPSS